jgi:hypothetical protein
MCAKTEIDFRESASECNLASGEGLRSGGETSHPMSLEIPFRYPGNALHKTRAFFDMPGRYTYVFLLNF